MIIAHVAYSFYGLPSWPVPLSPRNPLDPQRNLFGPGAQRIFQFGWRQQQRATTTAAAARAAPGGPDGQTLRALEMRLGVDLMILEGDLWDLMILMIMMMILERHFSDLIMILDSDCWIFLWGVGWGKSWYG